MQKKMIHKSEDVSDNQSVTQNNLFFENKELFVGMDVHKAKWVVTIRSYDLELKTFSMQPIPEALDKLLITTYPNAKYKIVSMNAALVDSGFTITSLKKATQ